MKAILCSVLFVIASVSLAVAQGTYTQIDVPGAVSTLPSGINTAGDIVGWYQDSSDNQHGFLLSAGVFTTIDYPGTTYNALSAINDVGQIIGTYSFPVESGFLYDTQGQTFTAIAFPGASETILDGINNAGKITGGVVFQQKGVSDGFEWSSGTFWKVAPPGGSNSEVTAVNNVGQDLVCAFIPSGGCHVALLSQGKFQKVRIPLKQVAPAGINDFGVIVGSYGTKTLGQLDTGFIYQNNTVQSLVFPGAVYTIAHGINNGGDVVGFFFDSNLIAHGFTWTPSSDAATK